MGTQPGARGGTGTDLERVDLARWQADANRWRERRRPVVIAGAFTGTVAVDTWTPDTIAQRYPDVEVRIQCSPPATGARPNPGTETTTMARFGALLREGRRCALKQQRMRELPGMDGELDLPRAMAPPYRAVNLWMGSGGRSPLHFDSAENLFVQVFGRKRFIIEPPTSSARRYLRHGDKAHFSQVDPLAPDPVRFPGYDPGEQEIALLDAGDALYLPPGWFHDVTALGTVVSANCWFGVELGGPQDRLG